MLKKEANFPTLLIFPPFKKMSICLSLYFVPWHLGRCCLPNKHLEQRRASPFHFYSIVSLIFTLKQTFLFSDQDKAGCSEKINEVSPLKCAFAIFDADFFNDTKVILMNL